MSSFVPHAVSTPYHFDIAQNRRGYWVAKDSGGLIGGVFRSRKDAIRFALFEAAGESAHVRVLPANSASPTLSSAGRSERRRNRTTRQKT
jgi:hypothetical protein